MKTEPKRRRAVLIALTALLALPAIPAAAQAQGTVSSTVAAGDPSEFWTPERMRAAESVAPPQPASIWPATSSNPLNSALAAAPGKPLDVPPAGAGGTLPGLSSASPRAGGGFRSGAIPNPAAPSVRMHGRVFFTVPGGRPASCSGTAIRSKRRNLVLTAGHCVHGGGHTGDWWKNWVFVPAYDDGNAPFGFFRASRLYAMPIFVEFGDPTGDIGFAAVRRNQGGRRLQGTVGARGIHFGGRAKQRYRSFGYPANPLDGFDGETERFCDSRFRKRDPRSKRGIGPQTMSIRCDMTQGASGGSWVGRRGRASSLNSYLYLNQKNVVYGPYFGSLARQLYEAVRKKRGKKKGAR